MTALGLAVLGALAAFPVLLWFTPDAGGFALAGSIMAACAAGGLRSRSAHAFYQPAGLPHQRTKVPGGERDDRGDTAALRAEVNPPALLTKKPQSSVAGMREPDLHTARAPYDAIAPIVGGLTVGDAAFLSVTC
jgi:hypothetical protein